MKVEKFKTLNSRLSGENKLFHDHAKAEKFSKEMLGNPGILFFAGLSSARMCQAKPRCACG
jgi:hypothetical protein